MKVVGPLFSLDAQGTLGKILTYGRNQFGNWARRIVGRKYTRTPLQEEVRKWFKDGLDTWEKMIEEEHFLWSLALTNVEAYGSVVGKNLHRWARCLFLHHCLSTRCYYWRGSPFPPELWQLNYTSQVANYDQIISDLETLTGLKMCEKPGVWALMTLGRYKVTYYGELIETIAGVACQSGTYIALDKDFYEGLDEYKKKYLVAHELTHCLLIQHGYPAVSNRQDHENIAHECGVRVANGQLTPIYTYKGKTLSEIVPQPSCS